MNTTSGAILSCVIALAIFWYREAGKVMDSFTKLLGLAMILITAYVAFSSEPPLGQALYRTVWPE
jgi:Mn2+/Fe2+ NRAMP family transporter